MICCLKRIRFQHVRDNVEIIEEKDSLGCVERKNMRILRDSLAEFLSVIEIVSEEHIKILQAANLSDPTKFDLSRLFNS